LRVIRPLLAALLLVAACTGSPSKKSTPNDFVDAACTDLATWGTTVQKAFTDLQNLGQVGTAGDPIAQEQLLGKLSASLNQAQTATAQLANGISARGTPNIASGDDVKKAILDALNQLREVMGKTRRAVDSFHVRTATKEESDALKLELDGLTAEVANTFAGLAPLNQNNDLRAAFTGSAACQQVASSFSS
jgi:hypothetical protein